MDMVFKNCPQGLPLTLQGASFGAIKIFTGKIFIGSSAGMDRNGPEVTIIKNDGRLFRPFLAYMTCSRCSVAIEIYVTRVMALKCQKKVRATSRKSNCY